MCFILNIKEITRPVQNCAKPMPCFIYDKLILKIYYLNFGISQVLIFELEGRQTSNWSNCSTKRNNCSMVFK